MLFRLTLLMLFIYFFLLRLEIMNASAIMDDAAIKNEYAGNSGIGIGVIRVTLA